LFSFLVNDSLRKYYLTAHPRLPVFYVTPMGNTYTLRFEHADGFVTLVPLQAELPGSAVTGPPLFMARRSKLVFPSNGLVFTVGLDHQGRFRQERGRALVPNPTVEAIAYSEFHDRLYVAVEKLEKRK
jgi:hypothetical protein